MTLPKEYFNAFYQNDLSTMQEIEKELERSFGKNIYDLITYEDKQKLSGLILPCIVNQSITAILHVHEYLLPPKDINSDEESLDNIIDVACCHRCIELLDFYMKEHVKQIHDIETQRLYQKGFSSGCRLDYQDVVSYLIEKGIDISYNDNESLITAAMYSNAHIVIFLIGKGINVQLGGEKAMIEASKFGFLDVVEILYNAGVSLDIVLEHGNEQAKKWASSVELSNRLESQLTNNINKKKQKI